MSGATSLRSPRPSMLSLHRTRPRAARDGAGCRLGGGRQFDGFCVFSLSDSPRSIFTRVRLMAGRSESSSSDHPSTVKWYLSPSSVLFLGMLAAEPGDNRCVRCTHRRPRRPGVRCGLRSAWFTATGPVRSSFMSPCRLQRRSRLMIGLLESNAMRVVDAQLSALPAMVAELDAVRRGAGRGVCRCSAVNASGGSRADAVRREIAGRAEFVDAQLSTLPAMVAGLMRCDVRLRVAEFVDAHVNASGDGG